jgi:hypothetical protein
MSKATLESASRRSVVKGAGAALAALAVPATAIAAASPDRIFGAAQQAYTDCFNEAIRLQAEAAPGDAERAYDAHVIPYMDASDNALQALLVMPATTLAGVIAGLEYLATLTVEYPAPESEWSKILWKQPPRP